MNNDARFVGTFSKDTMDKLLGEETSKLWKALSEFDPKKEYPYNPEGKEMTKHNRGLLLGKMNRLAQTLVDEGCSDLDVWIRVFKHTMVLIDALKYRLDYEKSYVDERIYEFKNKWK